MATRSYALVVGQGLEPKDRLVRIMEEEEEENNNGGEEAEEEEW